MGYIVETFRWCKSTEYDQQEVAGSNGAVYRLMYSSHIPGPYQCNWDCTCPGFRYRRECKHVKAAEEARCGHGVMAAAGSPENDWPDGKCPKCGAIAVPVRVAV